MNLLLSIHVAAGGLALVAALTVAVGRALADIAGGVNKENVK